MGFLQDHNPHALPKLQEPSLQKALFKGSLPQHAAHGKSQPESSESHMPDDALYVEAPQLCSTTSSPCKPIYTLKLKADTNAPTRRPRCGSTTPRTSSNLPLVRFPGIRARRNPRCCRTSGTRTGVSFGVVVGGEGGVEVSGQRSFFVPECVFYGFVMGRLRTLGRVCGDGSSGL